MELVLRGGLRTVFCLQGVDLDNWIEKVRNCQYLQEDELKALCEYVSHVPHASSMAVCSQSTLDILCR